LEKYYKSSIYLMLKTLYPEVDWKPWLFKKLPEAAIMDPNVTVSAVKFVEIHQNIKVPEDWNRVSKKQLDELKVRKLFTLKGGLAKVLSGVYPNKDWTSLSA
jgi:hypothetical protein